MSGIKVATPFVSRSWCMKYPLIFSLWTSVCIRWTSCTLQTVGFCFLIPSMNPHLLNGELRSLTLRGPLRSVGCLLYCLLCYWLAYFSFLVIFCCLPVDLTWCFCVTRFWPVLVSRLLPRKLVSAFWNAGVISLLSWSFLWNTLISSPILKESFVGRLAEVGRYLCLVLKYFTCSSGL